MEIGSRPVTRRPVTAIWYLDTQVSYGDRTISAVAIIRLLRTKRIVES